MTTIDTITHAQIRNLSEEAVTAGDFAQEAICDRALGRYYPDLWAAQLGNIEGDRIAKMSPATATHRCVDAIRAAEAQN